MKEILPAEMQICDYVIGEMVEVRITIMKKGETNWFWIHHIDEKVPNYSTHPMDRIKRDSKLIFI